MLPESFVSFHSEDEALQKLFDIAEEIAKGNLQYFGQDRVLVEGGGYEKIWLETQPMGGEMYACRDMTAALNNQLFFMKLQRADGRLAGSIQCFPDGTIEPQFNKFQGFCFPYHALNMYYWAKQDESYLRLLAETLEKFDGYLWRFRDSNGDGLLETWCAYDTGEDNAVRYGDAPNYCTTDTPPEGYEVVPIASMDFTSFSYASRDTLSRVYHLLGDEVTAASWAEKAQAVKNTIREKLWNTDRGACFDKDKHGNEMPVLLHNNLRCMYWGSFSQEMADRFVKEHLLNKEEFWTFCPLPSVAVNDPLFRNAPENNWSGQSEGLTFQRAIMALNNYGYEKLVTKLGRKLMKIIIRGGYVFTQQFDPFTGEPSKVGMMSHQVLKEGDTEAFQDGYGPTILAVLGYYAHMWGATQHMGQWWFSMASAKKSYCYTQHWDGKEYTVESNGKMAKAFMDGKLVYQGKCGVRVICDALGNVVKTVKIE